ncbi:MAG: hypothetical protein ACRELX_00475 [Longimicrobiales bacterium]
MRRTLGIAVLATFTLAGCRMAQVESGTPTPDTDAQPAAVADDVVPAGTQMVVEMNETLDTENTAVGDAFTATVKEDVQLSGRTFIPAGAVVNGTVTGLDDSDHAGDQAAIRLNFETIAFSGESYDLDAEITKSDVEVEDRGDLEDVAKKAGIGAAAGAILGAVIGGDLEAVLVGGALGAGAGTIISLGLGDAEAALPRGTDLTLRTTEQIQLR